MQHALLTEIDRFLRHTGMAPSRLGRDALGDPGFVAGVRAGRRVYQDTAEKLRAFMDAYQRTAA